MLGMRLNSRNIEVTPTRFHAILYPQQQEPFFQERSPR